MLKNAYPRTIEVMNISVNLGGVDFLVEPEHLLVEPGRKATFSLRTDSSFVVGQKERGSFVVAYRRAGGSYVHNISGSFVVNVQPQEFAIHYCGDNHVDADLDEDCDPPDAFPEATATCRSDCSEVS